MKGSPSTPTKQKPPYPNKYSKDAQNNNPTHPILIYIDLLLIYDYFISEILITHTVWYTFDIKLNLPVERLGDDVFLVLE